MSRIGMSHSIKYSNLEVTDLNAHPMKEVVPQPRQVDASGLPELAHPDYEPVTSQDNNLICRDVFLSFFGSCD